MTRKQIQICADILIYAHVCQLENLMTESEEERDVVAKAIEIAEAKVNNYPLVPVQELSTIINYVKDNY
jgi:hypothetical protein